MEYLTKISEEYNRGNMTSYHLRKQKNKVLKFLSDNDKQKPNLKREKSDGTEKLKRNKKQN